MNKYYLLKQILMNDLLTGPLDFDKNDVARILFGGEELTFEEAYNNRKALINTAIMNRYIGGIENLTGSEALFLIKEREHILKCLEQDKYAKMLHENGNDFRYILENLLRKSIDTIIAYEEAEKLLTGKRFATVIIDNNNNNLPKPVKTEVINNDVTLAKCKELCENIGKFGHEAKSLIIDLSVYTSTKGNECYDFAEECLSNKRAHYNVVDNTLTIWEDGIPVLQDVNGEICTDKAVLADCLM